MIQPLLLETIQVNDGKFVNIGYHNDRYDRARKELFGATDTICIQTDVIIPVECDDRRYKCRIIYSDRIHSVEFIPYDLPRIRTLAIVRCDDIEYSYKFADRAVLDQLRAGAKADEILIIKNGYVTDTSFSNIALYDGSRWLTPSLPLLAGTKRQYLLDKGILNRAEIKENDLRDFKKCRLFNAMINWEDELDIPVQNIY